jgi:hypothetical protein
LILGANSSIREENEKLKLNIFNLENEIEKLRNINFHYDARIKVLELGFNSKNYKISYIKEISVKN